MGVLQTTVGELVTVKEHQPRAYTVMPIVWCIGYVHVFSTPTQGSTKPVNTFIVRLLAL